MSKYNQRCRSCGHRSHVDELLFKCPVCGSSRISRGKIQRSPVA